MDLALRLATAWSMGPASTATTNKGYYAMLTEASHSDSVGVWCQCRQNLLRLFHIGTTELGTFTQCLIPSFNRGVISFLSIALILSMPKHNSVDFSQVLLMGSENVGDPLDLRLEGDGDTGPLQPLLTAVMEMQRHSGIATVSPVLPASMGILSHPEVQL
ncbi:hypothetical protein J4Q44_G00386290 [Coregonus suidteri]|uniref:Uncharacterized protein n=1 Tax=Coregonus suidteri TaxID=861788 RepID=A0AAN8KI00_9TELE